MRSSSRIELVIEDFGSDPAAVTRLIGLEPAALGGTNGRAEEAPSWIFEISMPETESVEGQALALLRFLEAHAEKIRQAASQYTASIAIGISEHTEASPDEVALVPLIAAEISKLGLGIRVNFSL